MARPTNKAAMTVAVAVVLILFFLLAPVAFWHNEGPPIAGASVHVSQIPIYRSLGCATVGVGDLYAPTWFGLKMGCRPPILASSAS